MQNQTGPQPTNITTYFMKYRRLCNSYDMQLNSVSELERSLLIDCTPLAMNVSQLRMNVSHLVYKAVRLDLRDKRRCLRSETVSVSGAHVQARTGSVVASLLEETSSSSATSTFTTTTGYNTQFLFRANRDPGGYFSGGIVTDLLQL